MTLQSTDNTTTEKVLSFYKQLAFNRHSSVKKQIKDIKRKNPVESYPPIVPLLHKETSVMEVGSGTGWFSNSISYYYKAQVDSIDFNSDAVEFSQQVANKMNVPTRFTTADLFTYMPAKKHDLVISLGVLHHTYDCHSAIKRLCTEFVAPGGYVFIGLYHHYGRKPFLDHFKNLQHQGASEQQLFDRYRQLHSTITDETHLRSWFRDQVLHPHETQHTLEEMLPILDECNCSLVTTSINKFESIRSAHCIDAIIRNEKGMTETAIERLNNNVYYPGFFLFLAKKQA